MKVSPTLISIVLAGLAFILMPYSPMWLLELLASTRVGVAVMLLGVLAVVQFDVVVSLALSLAVAAVFIEHRKRLVMKIQSNLAPNTPEQVSKIGSNRTLIPSEVHPPSETPVIEEVTEEVAQIPRSEREPLDTIDAHSESIAKLMEENGFASLQKDSIF
jgi:hypothetical protein